MKTKLFAIFSLLFTLQVFAESQFNWELTSTHVDGINKYYGDKSSIRMNNSGNYIVWVLINTHSGKYSGESRLMTTEHDCARLRYRWVHVELYSNHWAKGQKESSYGVEELKSLGYDDWKYPKPNSNEDYLVNWVCKNK